MKKNKLIILLIATFLFSGYLVSFVAADNVEAACTTQCVGGYEQVYNSCLTTVCIPGNSVECVYWPGGYYAGGWCNYSAGTYPAGTYCCTTYNPCASSVCVGGYTSVYNSCLTQNTICTPSNVTFTIPSSVYYDNTFSASWGASGSVTDYKVVVDNGTPASLGTIVSWSGAPSAFGFSANSSHTLKIQACNAAGCTDSPTRTINILAPVPTSTYLNLPSSAIDGQDFTVSWGASGSVTYYEFFVDGSSLGNTTVTTWTGTPDLLSFAPNNTYSMMVRACNTYGCTDSPTQNIDIQAAPASVNSNYLVGYAWSDNIGWVSFYPNPNNDINNISYGVSFDGNTNNFSGYAWSDNIGWIDFSPSSGYPETPSHGARLASDGSVIGWIRALSYGDGWDGWIKLSGVASDGSNYGVDVNSSTGVLSGFAWGSDVVGWVSFDAVIPTPVTNIITGVTPYVPYNNVTYPTSIPTINNQTFNNILNINPPPVLLITSGISSVNLSVNPVTITQGQSATLTWVSQDMTSCTGSWVGGSPVGVNGSLIISPSVDTTYTIDCIGTFNNDVSSTQITVIPLIPINAVDDTANVNENSFVNINVLSNDSGNSIFVDSVTNPSCGSVVNNVSSVRYVNTSYCGGSDSFEYTIEDSSGNQENADVDVTIYDCGDGVVQGGEACDLGAGNGACPSSCSSACTLNIGCAVCGDGTCDPQTETFLTCPVDCPATFIEF